LTITAPTSEAAAAARAPYAATPSAQTSTTATAPDPTAAPIRRAFHSTTACRTAGRPTPLAHCTPSSSAYTVNYVLRRRIELAQGLMLTTSEPLSSIAVNCGMCDQSHFTRSFHRIVGETPYTWRRTRRGSLQTD
jgi:AraC-like DNA-binding protein